MPRWPIYKHTGITVKVKKKKEEKRGAKKATTQQANMFVPLPQKGESIM